MNPPDTLEELVCDALDRLIELGGGTVDGIAEYLEEQDMRGEPKCAGDCPIANWIFRELWAANRCDFVDLEITPNSRFYDGGAVSWDQIFAFGVPHVQQWVWLPAVLSDLGDDFDLGKHPELEAA